MFFGGASRDAFEREVRTEIAYLTELHGEAALEAARQKAARRTNRTARQKVLDEVVRRLSTGATEGSTGLLGRLFPRR